MTRGEPSMSRPLERIPFTGYHPRGQHLGSLGKPSPFTLPSLTYLPALSPLPRLSPLPPFPFSIFYLSSFTSLLYLAFLPFLTFNSSFFFASSLLPSCIFVSFPVILSPSFPLLLHVFLLLSPAPSFLPPTLHLSPRYCVLLSFPLRLFPTLPPSPAPPTLHLVSTGRLRGSREEQNKCVNT